MEQQGFPSFFFLGLFFCRILYLPMMLALVTEKWRWKTCGAGGQSLYQILTGIEAKHSLPKGLVLILTPPRFLDLPTAMLSIVAMSLCRIVDIAPPDFGKYIKPIQ